MTTDDVRIDTMPNGARAIIHVGSNNPADMELIPALLDAILRGEDEDGDKLRFLISLHMLGSLSVAAA